MERTLRWKCEESLSRLITVAVVFHVFVQHGLNERVVRESLSAVISIHTTQTAPEVVGECRAYLRHCQLVWLSASKLNQAVLQRTIAWQCNEPQLSTCGLRHGSESPCTVRQFPASLASHIPQLLLKPDAITHPRRLWSRYVARSYIPLHLIHLEARTVHQQSVDTENRHVENIHWVAQNLVHLSRLCLPPVVRMHPKSPL
mmetsp:Transcript_56362/g.125789  ORF Transcript_56362/g.125789 Transcript_56362/m.125789 type:complete len:201 (-) Transcript_56362:1791-2393(-)